MHSDGIKKMRKETRLVKKFPLIWLYCDVYKKSSNGAGLFWYSKIASPAGTHVTVTFSQTKTTGQGRQQRQIYPF